MLTTANLDDVTAAAGTMTSLNVEQHSLFMETITVGYGEVRVCVCESACLCVCVRVCVCASVHACVGACVPLSAVSKPWSAHPGRAITTANGDAKLLAVRRRAHARASLVRRDGWRNWRGCLLQRVRDQPHVGGRAGRVQTVGRTSGGAGLSAANRFCIYLRSSVSLCPLDFLGAGAGLCQPPDTFCECYFC